MRRQLQPELLDTLAPGHPDALHNRRDLRIINRAAGNYRWFARTLSRQPELPASLLEIGAGTGELGNHLAAKMICADGLDLWPEPDPWPAGRRWHRADLLSFDGYGEYPVVIGNLIFHQFSAGQLAELGARLRQSSGLILANEPARRRRWQALYRVAGPLLGANYVSRHDAHVSVAAGFLGDELPRMLGLPGPEWDCRCHTTLLGMYRMIARRK